MLKQLSALAGCIVALFVGLQSFTSSAGNDVARTTQDAAWSNAYEQLLVTGTEHMVTNQTETCEQEAAVIWNPASFSITSGCWGSLCTISACTVSGCIGSGCIVSWCEGSGCIDSGCELSLCVTSGCELSACVKSGCATSGCKKSSCQNSTCVNSNCAMSNCTNSGCYGSVCCPKPTLPVLSEAGDAEEQSLALNSAWWETFDLTTS